MARSRTDPSRMQHEPLSAAILTRAVKSQPELTEIKGKSRKPPIMRQYDLIERVRRYNRNTDEALLNRAYVYAMKAHGAQIRASGDPYFSHPLEVAAILTDMKLDDATIVAAVLHDTIEDTESTREEIDKLFGSDIGRLVDGLTKLKKLDLVSKRAEQAENFRKLLLAVVEDVRVLLVKLADRLHNMRTLQFVVPDKRTRIAEETIDIYAPLAGRMGMQRMRDELDDLAFRHLMPDAYAMIAARLQDIKDTDHLPLLAESLGKLEGLENKGGEAEFHEQVYNRIDRAYRALQNEASLKRPGTSSSALSTVPLFDSVMNSVRLSGPPNANP